MIWEGFNVFGKFSPSLLLGGKADIIGGLDDMLRISGVIGSTFMTKQIPRMDQQLGFDFSAEKVQVSTAEVESPSGYTGFYRFHKYWGKKPYEPLAYVIEHLTSSGDVILDPFCGSGTAGREALLRSRKFIGFDINPVAIVITRLLIHPPSLTTLKKAVRQVEEAVKQEILNSYLLQDGTSVATHYLWNSNKLEEVWLVGRGAARRRQELAPTVHDKALSNSFAEYHSKLIREPRFFKNSRINAAPQMNLDDLFTGRAQRNIDLLIQAIEDCPDSIRPALKLCLTAASGQMTQMVFAVTGRGKTTGDSSEKKEVGSWVIGYWRPKLHFEVNVWSCFAKRTSTLLKAISTNDLLNRSRLTSSVSKLIRGESDAMLTCGDCRSLLSPLPDECVQLVITDPPHSDRMPYLELSELWNSILGLDPDFSREIVISNAKERDKTSDAYRVAMMEFLAHVPRVLKSNGVLVLMFNASKAEEWEAFRAICGGGANGGAFGLRYLGVFPCQYSARSVVQDNRKGSLRNDFALVFCKADRLTSDGDFLRKLESIPDWSSELPEHLQ